MIRRRTQFHGEPSGVGIIIKYHWLLTSIPAIIALSACGTGKGANVASNEQISKYPDGTGVRKTRSVAGLWMPIDGKTHVSRKGNFIVVPTTMFCVTDRHLDKVADYANMGGVYIYEYLHQAGQSDKYHGVGRVFFDKCPAEKGTIRISRTLSLNDKGVPYKLSWIASQDEARLELSMQRDAKDKRHWPIKPNQYSVISEVITHDGSNISQLMASILFQGARK